MTITSGKNDSQIRRQMLHTVHGVHEFSGWKIKIYQYGKTIENVSWLDGVMSDVLALANVGCGESRCPVGFCVVTKVSVSTTEVVLGLWAVSESVRLMQFNFRLGAMVAAKNDLTLQSAEIIAYETRAIKVALETRSNDEEMERQYLSDCFSADPEQPSHTAMRNTFERFANAWRQGDIDGLMENMAASPSYRTSGGVCFEGREAVRKALAELCKSSAKASTSDDEPNETFFFANRSLSYWSLSLPSGDGAARDVKGIDVITYDADGRIVLKDAYRKLS